MSKERAFVRYTKQGKIVPGSLILSKTWPDGPGIWREVSMDLCCTTTTMAPTTTTTTDNPTPPRLCFCYNITNNQESTQSFNYRNCQTNIISEVSVEPNSTVYVCSVASFIPEAIGSDILDIQACLVGGSELICTSNTECIDCIGLTTTTTEPAITTTTEPPCCYPGILDVNVTVPGVTVTGINIDDLDGWYDAGSIGFPIDNTSSPRSVSLQSNADGTLNIIVDNDDVDNDHYLYLYFNCVQVGSCCVIPSRSTGHVCSFPAFPISSYETDCIEIEITNISCT